MLSGLLNLARFRNGIAYPYHLDLSTKNQALAENLLELFQSSLTRKRYELEEEIKAFYVEKVNPKVVQGLARILFNRSEFRDFGEKDPQAVREKVFTASAVYWNSAPSFKIAFNFHKQNILQSAGISAEIAYQETDAWLFGDISSNQILDSFESISAENLIHRYNIEQIQGLLLHAEKIELKVMAMTDNAFKQVMQMLKFFQLMFQVTDADSNWLTLVIDGPGSILDNARTYGIEFANFFPAILLLSVPWLFTATLKMPNRHRKFALELSDQNELQSFYQQKGIWNHEKVLNFIERFNQKYDSEFTAFAENRLIPLKDNRYLMPDLVVKTKHDQGSFLVEWIHYISDAKIKQLGKIKDELPKNYLFAIKGKKAKLAGLQKKLGNRLVIYTKEFTAPSLYKSINDFGE